MSTPADVAGAVAELGPQAERLTPEALCERFCGSPDSELPAGMTMRRRGFCGWTGQGSLGYDDGYYFMEDLTTRGWRPLASKGDWPYVVYMIYPGERPTIAEYCEADLSVWSFASVADAKAFVGTLKGPDE